MIFICSQDPLNKCQAVPRVPLCQAMHQPLKMVFMNFSQPVCGNCYVSLWPCTTNTAEVLKISFHTILEHTLSGCVCLITSFIPGFHPIVRTETDYVNWWSSWLDWFWFIPSEDVFYAGYWMGEQNCLLEQSVLSLLWLSALSPWLIAYMIPISPLGRWAKSFAIMHHDLKHNCIGASVNFAL